MNKLSDKVKLVLATHNQHKLFELHQILAEELNNFDPDAVVSAAGLGAPEPKEDGVTFEQNALLKAHALTDATGLPAIADDSGICVDVLGGAPGIFSARWAGRHGDGGFGYDPIFRPDGYEVTTAQMSPEQKNQISHRGISFRALAKDIAPLL